MAAQKKDSPPKDTPTKAEHTKAEHTKAEHTKAEHTKAEHSKAEHTDEDELHRKFREALENKKSGTGASSRSKGDGGKPHAAAGPAHQQRMFRRKSGG